LKYNSGGDSFERAKSGTGSSHRSLGASAKNKKKERLTLILQTVQCILKDFYSSDSSVQLERPEKENKKPPHQPTQEFKFLPQRFFGEAVFAITHCSTFKSPTSRR